MFWLSDPNKGVFYAARPISQRKEKEKVAFVTTTLSQYSPHDKPWAIHKAENKQILMIYAGTTAHIRKAERLLGCSGVLEFGEEVQPDSGEVQTRLLKAEFCRVRYCPICQWRRSLFWRAKFYKALPGIISKHSTARFLFLTLTIKNCEVATLRESIQAMNTAWNRFTQRKAFSSIIGWVRTTEVTRGQDNTAHPHFHCLLMVPAGYFAGHSYVKQAEWRDMWKKSLRIDYEPIVDIRTVKLKQDKTGREGPVMPHDGLIETLKYSVKPADMIAAPDWSIKLTEQTHKLRFIATGGVFKDVLKPEEAITSDEMIHIGENPANMELVKRIMRFLWEDKAGEYILEQMRLLP